MPWRVSDDGSGVRSFISSMAPVLAILRAVLEGKPQAAPRPLRSSPLSADAIDPATSNKQRDIWRRRLEQFPNPAAARRDPLIEERRPSAHHWSDVSRKEICKPAWS